MFHGKADALLPFFRPRVLAHYPLALPPEGKEGACYFEGCYSFLGQHLDCFFGFLYFGSCFQCSEERQGSLLAGKVDEDLQARANAILLNKGPPSSAKILV